MSLFETLAAATRPKESHPTRQQLRDVAIKLPIDTKKEQAKSFQIGEGELFVRFEVDYDEWWEPRPVGVERMTDNHRITILEAEWNGIDLTGEMQDVCIDVEQ